MFSGKPEIDDDHRKQKSSKFKVYLTCLEGTDLASYSKPINNPPEVPKAHTQENFIHPRTLITNTTFSSPICQTQKTIMSTGLIGSNLVRPRPKEEARYTIRELLILGLTLPIRFCPINKFGPEAIGLDIVSLDRINESLIQYEREQMRQWQIAQHQARKKAIEDARLRYKKEEQEKAKVASV